ncbi:MAG TPA: TldD/PmbA family protein [Candidatus Limnocylindrales bacterium]|jgi:predicted Zn-dependent protease|nr:TldD/PmbA family protein [Candidatus Limnocylindrales bacterium]
MNDDRAHDALELAERVLALATAAGASEAEALVMSQDAALTRFANSQIHQNVAETDVTINLRFVVGKRVGVASSGRTDDEGLRRLVDNAAAIARVVEELGDWAGLPAPTQVEPVPAAYSVATAGATPELRAEGARAVIAAADEAGVTAFGSFSTGTETVAVANSTGIRVGSTRTTAQLLTVSMGPNGGTGYAEQAAVDATTIDPAAIGRESAAKARATADAVAIDAGDYPVVLEEYAVVDLLDMLGYLGFSALAVQEERSFFEPGRRIGTDLVTIVDDGRDPAGLPMAFDYEGVAKQRVELVVDGLCRAVVHDAQTAARDGVASTGHGLPAPNPWGPFPLNMVMEAGAATREELIGGLDRGLLVTRFHYTNPVHPKLAIITGMTRDGTFLVEGGRIVGPVRNLRYTQSYLDALACTVAVAAERKTLKGFLGGVVVPALRLDGWTFTGTTEH